VHVAIDGRLAGYSQGGIAQYTVQLARALAALDAPERLTLLRAARPVVQSETVANMPSAGLLTPPHHRFEQLTLPLELLRLRPDVLHSPDFIPPFRRPCRSVITVHDLGFLHYPETLTEQSRRYYGRIGRAVQSADRIIAVSSCTKRDLETLLQADPQKIDVVLEAADPKFQPVETEVELAAARRRLGVDKPYLLFVGSFEPRKDLVTLLDAFALVRQQVDLQLALVGRRGWLYEPIFQRRAELGLEDGVKIVEDFEHADLQPIYSAAVALAFPSLYEGFGLPAVEAMACGCPVVASDRGSLPEVVGQAGCLVPAQDAQALAEALLRVVTDEDWRRELVRRGLERAKSFSWHRAAEETLDVYRRAAA
jgi:glycosyltransferase involved in cell wall biosynthesis